MTKKSKGSKFRKRFRDYKNLVDIEIRWSFFGQKKLSEEEKLLHEIINRMSYREVFQNVTLRDLLYKYFNEREV